MQLDPKLQSTIVNRIGTYLNHLCYFVLNVTALYITIALAASVSSHDDNTSTRYRSTSPMLVLLTSSPFSNIAEYQPPIIKIDYIKTRETNRSLVPLINSILGILLE